MMRFEPALLHAAIGDTVRWTNLDLVPHTATSTKGVFNSGVLPPDSSWVTVVASTGVQEYGCLNHPEMRARIVVGPSGTPR
jgi:plastocyanin